MKLVYNNQKYLIYLDLINKIVKPSHIILADNWAERWIAMNKKRRELKYEMIDHPPKRIMTENMGSIIKMWVVRISLRMSIIEA